MRTVTVTGDALDLDDVVAVARGQADAVLGPDVAARMAPTRDVVADAVEPRPGDVRHHHRLRRAGRHPDRAAPTSSACSWRSSARTPPAVGDAAARRRRPRPAAAAGADAGGRDLRGAGRPAGPAARPAEPRPAAGHPGQGLGRGLRRPRPAGPPRAAARRRGPAAPRAATPTCAAAPARSCSPRTGIEPLVLAAQGGAVPHQRHRADAGAARLAIDEVEPAAQGGRRRLRDERWTRCSAPTAPYDPRVVDIRPQPGQQLASAGNLRAAAGRLRAARQPPPRHDARRAGLLLRCAAPRRCTARSATSWPTPAGSLDGRARLGRRQPGHRLPGRAAPDRDYEVMSTGNFHGEPLAFAGDMLAIAVAELASHHRAPHRPDARPGLLAAGLPAVPRHRPGHQLAAT